MRKYLIFIGLLLFEVSTAQIVNVEDLRSNLGDTTGMFERLNVGFSFVKNDQEIFTLNSDFQIEILEENQMFLSVTSLSFLKAGNTNFVNSGLQHLRYNYSIREWLKWEAFGQVQYNEQLRIRLRALAGTGPRFNFEIKEKNSLNLGLSYMWEYEEITEPDETEHDQRLNSYLGFFWDLSPLNISSTTYFQPLFTDLSDHRLSNTTSLTTDFKKNWSIKVTFTLTYDSRLPESVPDLIYSVVNSIQYRF